MNTIAKITKPNVYKGLSRDKWAYADPHFYHEKIIGMVGRPFATVEDMNEELIKRYNELVKPYDLVFFMGDVVFGDDANWEILRRLHGEKRLILGNHDTINFAKGHTRLLDHFASIEYWYKDKSAGMILSHVPLHQSQLISGGAMNDPATPRMFQIHGHTHESGSPPGPYRSVCVELTDYKPVHYSQLKEWSREWHTKQKTAPSS